MSYSSHKLFKGDALPKKAKRSSVRTKRASPPKHHDDVEREALLQLFDLTSRSRPYSGQLKAPIARVSKLELMLRGGPEEQERFDREEDVRIVAEQLERLFLLLDHFKVPRSSRLRWFHLAFRLARQHVRGMEVVEGPPPKRGPKGKRKGTPSDHEFLVALTGVELERKRGTADAIHILWKRYPDSWGRLSERTLRNRYFKLRKEIVAYPEGDMIDNLKALFGLNTRNRKP